MRHQFTTLTLLAGLAVQAGAQESLFKLTPSDGSPGADFGYAVSISGGRAIVGARAQTGAAYLFDMQTGLETHKLTSAAGAPPHLFGSSVAIDGDRAACGAPDHGGAGDPGSAFLYDAALGTELLTLNALDRAPGDGLGLGVGISGGHVVASARWDNNGNGANAGGAYAFDLATGSQVHKFVAADGAQADEFGTSIAIHGDRVIVGARWDDNQNGGNAGAAYVFDVDTGNQVWKFVAPGGAPGHEFGVQVDLWGELAVIGTAGAGAAYVFDLVTGQQVSTLTASDAQASDGFGNNVAIWDGVAVIGAPDMDQGPPSAPITGAGAVYLFDAASGVQFAKLTASDAQANDSFGKSVDIDQGTILVGSRSQLSGNGAAYAYAVDDCDQNGVPDGYQIILDPGLDLDGDGVLDACDDCMAVSYCLAAGNTAGTQALMSSLGSPSIASNDFVLTVAGAPPLKPATFFYGASQALMPLGEGVLCLGWPVQRVQPLILTDQQGAAALPIDFTSAPFSSGPFAVAPHETWNFQLWYRDPLGGPAGFNFSDALEVLVCP